MHVRLTAALTAICTALILLTGAHAAGAAEKTVTMSGKAYIFNHMDTGISGATIKVREFPKISATTDEFGDYEMEVPDDANVTPYILSGEGLLTKRKFEDNTPNGQVQTHWNEIDLQTFHTRGADLENANFQAPADGEFAGLMAILSVPAREDGRPEQCAIVTTSSARNVRGVDYHTFWDNTPHGVPGATSIEYPAIDGPIYFNESVIPDTSKTESSEDGGIVWPIVPTGTYRIVTSAPDARFASFLVTCEPGRVINANPPWGAYELSPGEKPLAASNVAAKVGSAKVQKSKSKRTVVTKIASGERIAVSVKVKKGGKVIGSKQIQNMTAANKTIKIPVKRKISPGKASLQVKLTDTAGVSFTTSRKLTLPKVK